MIAWKHAKLMEVSVSPDPKNPDAEGSVSLVREGSVNNMNYEQIMR